MKYSYGLDHGNHYWQVLDQLPRTMGWIHTALCLVLVIKTFSEAVVFFHDGVPDVALSSSTSLLTYRSLTRRMSWWKRSTCSKLALSVTEKTMRNPSPVLMYCSLIALNSSCPAVSSTVDTEGHKYTSLKGKTDWNLKSAFALTIQYGPLPIDLRVFEVRVLYRGIVVWHKDFLEKLDGQGALPDATIPHHHQLVCRQVVAGYGAGRHGCSFSGPQGEKSAGGGLVRHTCLRWSNERDAERHENGWTIARGGDTESPQATRDRRPQAW